MELQERTYQSRPRMMQPPSGTPTDDEDRGLQEQGRRELDLARELINRALSGDSESFNRAMRQQGGQ